MIKDIYTRPYPGEGIRGNEPPPPLETFVQLVKMNINKF